MSLINDHITIKDGQARIKGTEVPVIIVWGHLCSGHTPERIIKSYPTLTHDDIEAVKLLLEGYF